MKMIFEVPKKFPDKIDDILGLCDVECLVNEKSNLSGDQIIAITAIATPIVWNVVDKYLSDRVVTIQIELDENTTVTISERSAGRALMKAKKIRTEWERQNSN